MLLPPRSQVALNLIVDVVVSDATRATDVQTGVSGANEALVLDAIVFALNNPAEGSALAAISVSPGGATAEARAWAVTAPRNLARRRCNESS